MKKRDFCLILFFLSLLSLYLLSEAVIAENITQSLELLQNLVNNPSEARKMRKKFKSASKKERLQFAELNKALEKEISSMASSLPKNIDKYTTWDAAAVSGKKIAFKYTLSKDHVDITNKTEFMSEMNNMLKKGFCTSPQAAYLILGYAWSYFYYREDGTYYGGIFIDAKTCGFE